MKKTFKTAAVCAMFAVIPAACDLTAINENPNLPTSEVDYNLDDARLAAAFRTGLPAVEGDDEQRVKSLMVDFYAQMLDGGSFTTRNYVMNEDWNQRLYRRVQNAIASLNIVIRNLNDRRDEYGPTIAVAKIWRVYVESIGIDCFGPLPFAKYTEVEANPPYMSVENAYNEFFGELDDAVALLDKDGLPIFNDAVSDIVYRNDAAKWKKFANSLRLRLALRLSEVKPETCRTQAAKAIAAGVMESAADNAYIPPKADGNWGTDYNYVMFQITWGGPLKMTTTIEKLITGIGGGAWPDGVVNRRSGLAGGTPVPVSSEHPAKVDPRATAMFDPAYENGAWKGYPDGMGGSLVTGDYAKNVLWAELGTLIRNGARYTTRPYDLFLYEEVCFLKAEAALRGFIVGNAKAEYEKGVRASFVTWGVTAKADEYLASTEKNLAGTSAKYDDVQTGGGNTALEKIITQKYLALFPDMSMEAWSDHRRLNLPRFDVPMFRDELLYDNNDRDFKKPANFIRRVQYPQNEIQINKAEYDKALQLLGGRDVVSTRIWWDTGANMCTSDQ